MAHLVERVVSAMANTSHHNAPTGLLLGLTLAFILLVRVPTADAQATAAPGPPPPQVQQLLQLLQDPAVRGWVDQQHQPAPAPVTAEPAPPTFSTMMAARTVSLRAHLAALAAAAPRLPSEFRSAADRLLAELQGRRLVGVLILVLGFVALGAGTEWIFTRVTARPRQRIVALPIETT